MTVLDHDTWLTRPLMWDAPEPTDWDELLAAERLVEQRREALDWATPGVTGLGAGDVASLAVPVSPVVAGLLAAVEAVRAADVLAVPGPQALADARAVLDAGKQLRLVALTRLADVETRGLHDLDGAATTAQWLGRQDLDLPRGDLALAKRLRAFPHLHAVLTSGAVSLGTARVLQTALTKTARFLDRPDGLVDGQPQEPVLHAVIIDGIRQLTLQALGGLPDLTGPDGQREHDPRVLALIAELTLIATADQPALERLEQGLLVLAQQVAPANLAGAVGLLIDALLPQQLQDRADQAHRDRGLTLTRNPDGSGWHLRGDLDLLAGERLYVLLHHEALRDPLNPTDTQAAQAMRTDGLDPHDPTHQHHGPTPDHPGEATPTDVLDLHAVAGALPDCAVPRSRRQRLHDAFSNLLGRALDHGLVGVSGKNTPHLNITVSLDTLHGTPGTLPALASSGTPLPAGLTSRLACDSRLTRLLMSLGGKQLQHSHTGRTATHAERAAKALETGRHCQAAGCTRAPDLLTATEIHHATPWATTHTTAHDDSIWLCTTSHDQLHHGHTLQLTNGNWLGPHGWTTPPPPPPTWAEQPPF